MRKARDMAEVEHDFIKDKLERVRAELERVRLVPPSSVTVPTLPGPYRILIEDLMRRLDPYRSERNSTRDRCHELLEDVKGLTEKSGKLSRLLLVVGGKPSFSRCESLCEGFSTIFHSESVVILSIYSDDEESEVRMTEVGGRGEHSYASG
ncbi:hypothetical protein AMTR_s00004p00269080 [Amborella trichopoda]|uniref:Uncharacterized protein n=1 Tax=Amborella trichopoda TaxID=13333 RepID=W1NEE9_AMBTC|nr:hypothetical protein AMTR_s00004p00269080 [Amborella trichopoda]